jgi:hypothetical protein
MTHPYSVSDIKNKRRHASSRDQPREGTRLRFIYDKIFAEPGQWIIFSAKKDFGWWSFASKDGAGSLGNMLDQLQNSYGLDIRTRRLAGAHGRAQREVMLAGEWFGRVYIDYTQNPDLAKNPRVPGVSRSL